MTTAHHAGRHEAHAGESACRCAAGRNGLQVRQKHRQLTGTALPAQARHQPAESWENVSVPPATTVQDHDRGVDRRWTARLVCRPRKPMLCTAVASSCRADIVPGHRRDAEVAPLPVPAHARNGLGFRGWAWSTLLLTLDRCRFCERVGMSRVRVSDRVATARRAALDSPGRERMIARGEGGGLGSPGCTLGAWVGLSSPIGGGGGARYRCGHRLVAPAMRVSCQPYLGPRSSEV
jgi:hypothetical protein